MALGRPIIIITYFSSGFFIRFWNHLVYAFDKDFPIGSHQRTLIKSVMGS